MRRVIMSVIASATAFLGASAHADQPMIALQRMMMEDWQPDCRLPGMFSVSPSISFQLNRDGHASQIQWTNRRNDPIWQAGAVKAIEAVSKAAAESTDFPPYMYDRKITFTFWGTNKCSVK